MSAMLLQPGQGVDLADERVRGDREERVVELVIVGQWRVGLRNIGDDRVDVGLHLGHQLGGLGDVAGERTELLDLGVRVVERRRRRTTTRAGCRSPPAVRRDR